MRMFNFTRMKRYACDLLTGTFEGQPFCYPVLSSLPRTSVDGWCAQNTHCGMFAAMGVTLLDLETGDGTLHFAFLKSQDFY